MIDRSVIGTESEPGVNEVEKGAIRRFAEALEDENPLWRSEAAARAAGYRGLVAPPTFPTSFRAGSDVRVHLDVGDRPILQAEEVYQYERPLVAGDVVILTERITDVQARSGPGGRMDLVTIEGEGVDPDGEVLYRSRRLLIVRDP